MPFVAVLFGLVPPNVSAMSAKSVFFESCVSGVKPRSDWHRYLHLAGFSRFARAGWCIQHLDVVHSKAEARESGRISTDSHGLALSMVYGHQDGQDWKGVRDLRGSFRDHYYLMSNGYHTNYTGCGNTLPHVCTC